MLSKLPTLAKVSNSWDADDINVASVIIALATPFLLEEAVSFIRSHQDSPIATWFCADRKGRWQWSINTHKISKGALKIRSIFRCTFGQPFVSKNTPARHQSDREGRRPGSRRPKSDPGGSQSEAEKLPKTYSDQGLNLNTYCGIPEDAQGGPSGRPEVAVEFGAECAAEFSFWRADSCCRIFRQFFVWIYCRITCGFFWYFEIQQVLPPQKLADFYAFRWLCAQKCEKY